jgi:hypothetical protein
MLEEKSKCPNECQKGYRCMSLGSELVCHNASEVTADDRAAEVSVSAVLMSLYGDKPEMTGSGARTE